MQKWSLLGLLSIRIYPELLYTEYIFSKNNNNKKEPPKGGVLRDGLRYLLYLNQNILKPHLKQNIM